MIENWHSNGKTLRGLDPHINFIQIYPDSPRGLNELQIHWDTIPGLYFSERDKEGSTTFTQPGSITPPHVDGCGLEKIVAHLDGNKIWIVWPPTEHNLRAIRNPERTLGISRELRLGRWLQELEEPEVFLTRKGDSFFLGPSVLHACVAVTKSAHFGIYCWRRESLGLAQLNIRILQEEYGKLAKVLAKRAVTRKKEDKEKDVSRVLRRIGKVDRRQEYADADLSLSFFRDIKSDWYQDDRQVWETMNENQQDQEISQWIPVVDKFFGQIKNKGK